ncbi:F0F1 ATP synthase subunit delta [Candidatus Gottesmanbacteria bacterium]|nr:F0F1 ATP synthase subunit delta [Candidatus Gottesmanbacteria bacterium]
MRRHWNQRFRSKFKGHLSIKKFVRSPSNFRESSMNTSQSKESSSVVQGILGFLSDTGKSNLLSSVAEVLDEVVDKTRNADEILITSAVPLTPPQVKKLGGIVSHFLKRDLPPVNKIDKRLLGGFSIRVGDFFLDASLANELDNIKQLILS